MEFGLVRKLFYCRFQEKTSLKHLILGCPMFRQTNMILDDLVQINPALLKLSAKTRISIILNLGDMPEISRKRSREPGVSINL